MIISVHKNVSKNLVNSLLLKFNNNNNNLYNLILAIVNVCNNFTIYVAFTPLFFRTVEIQNILF